MGTETNYNLGEQGMINQEYDAEWRRQFNTLLTDWNLQAQLRDEDLQSINTILQALFPGIRPAVTGDTLLSLIQQGMNMYSAREITPVLGG